MTEVEVKVEYAEQSKGVTAKTSIKRTADVTEEELHTFTEKLKKEADLLFESAFIKSQSWTTRK